MFIYGIFSTILFLLILPFYYIVRVINGKFLYGWKEKLGFLKAPDLGEKVIMYHGVSVGEIIALQNVVKKTKETFPDYKIVITTGTKTGQDIAQKKYEGIADFVTYFPFDIPFAVRGFLNEVKPSVVLIAETELWPTFAYTCSEREIPLFVINGRISDSTFKSYKMLKIFFKHILRFYTGIFTQSKEDCQKLIEIGAPVETTTVMKNLKFDVKKTDEKIEIGQNAGRVIIAGSTHKGEDEIVLEVFSNLKKEFSDIKLLHVPRHLTRIGDIEELVKSTGFSYGFRSKDDKFDKNDIILLDTMGELGKMYQVCDIAFIGGSFNKTGGHNPLEATVFEKPVVSGPSIHNFKDIYWLLTRSKAGTVVKTSPELEEFLRQLLKYPELYKLACFDCKTVFAEQQGALNFVIKKLSQIL